MFKKLVKVILGSPQTEKQAFDPDSAHPEKILAESNKILIQWDLVFMKVDALEIQKNPKIKIFHVDLQNLLSFINFLKLF